MAHLPSNVVYLDLPLYLSSYVANQCRHATKSLGLGDEKSPYLVDGRSYIGHYIISKLDQKHKPVKVDKNKTAFQIATQPGTIRNKTAERKYFYIPEKSYKLINIELKLLFEHNLYCFVAGAEFSAKSKNADARIRTKAIKEFCRRNGVNFTFQNIRAWVKMTYRHKNKPKKLGNKSLKNIVAELS